MNNDELKELAAMLNGIADGKEWEFKKSSQNWTQGNAAINPVSLFADGWQIRLKQWKLPDPPHGYEWHRTEDWTEEMLPDGWRPMLVGECIQYKDEIGGRNQSWVKITTRVGEIIDCTLQSHYRTQRPLPPPKPKLQEVELCADDIKAGDEFLSPDGSRRQWHQINATGISFVWAHALWAELKRHGWKMRSVGETEWRKCSKMQEVTA